MKCLFPWAFRWFNWNSTPSPAIAKLTAPAHNVVNIWEPYRDVLSVKWNQTKDLTPGTYSAYQYAVNDFGQRDSVDVSGSAFGSGERDRVWAYDEFGQLVSEADANNTDFSRGYDYDDIGNRLKSIQGDTDTEEPGAISYTPNNLNQYGTIGAFSPSYDDDGNARDWRIWSGGLQTADTLTLQNVVFIWDAENRLIEIQTPSEATLVKYTYDAQSRRIRQQASGEPDTVFFYDGWNLIAEYQVEPAAGTPTPPEWQAVKTATYLWGLDLSGSMQGAGGVGGLLSVTKGTNTYYPTYDGNGNVSEYLDTAGQIAVHYQYDAFGNILHYTEDAADLAKTFRHRFSTKPQDEESGLLYYGYRYYDPVTGRWPSRDPIEETGGINLYGFVGNDGVNWIDVLGLDRNSFLFPGPHIRPPAGPPMRPVFGASMRNWLNDFYQRNPNLTDDQKDWARRMLMEGCIGVTCLELGAIPRNERCYKTKEGAERAARLNEAAGTCAKPGIYSIQLWNDKENPTVTFDGERADLSNWDQSPRPAEGDTTFVNFDYGFLGPDGMIWGANLGYNPDTNFDGIGDRDPDGIISNNPKFYIRTTQEWQLFEDFNTMVWCYQCCEETYGVK